MDNFGYAEWTSAARMSSIVARHRAKAFKPCAALLAAMVLGCPTVSFAQAAEPAHSVFSHREQWLAAFEKLPEATLRGLFLRCDRESRERLLGLDEAVQCAMAWDALLKRGFAGDVNALLAWWRQQKGLATTRSTEQPGSERR